VAPFSGHMRGRAGSTGTSTRLGGTSAPGSVREGSIAGEEDEG
jgi:hypothetical protein